MGFIKAINDIGKNKLKDNSFNDSLAQLALPGSNDSNAILISLEVESLKAPYEVQKISNITVKQIVTGHDEDYWKLKYLFKKAPSPSAGWRYSPVYPLGKYSNKMDLEFESKTLETLKVKVFTDLEKKEIFTSGATQKIL